MGHDYGMVLTSPPYYDIEYYGDEEKQLGKCKTYEDFIDDITVILLKCYECLKPTGFCCWSVNDFRRKGIFHPYHSDIIQAYLKVGFRLHDIVITDLGYPIGAAFATQLEEQQRTAKRHVRTSIEGLANGTGSLDTEGEQQMPPTHRWTRSQRRRRRVP